MTCDEPSCRSTTSPTRPGRHAAAGPGWSRRPRPSVARLRLAVGPGGARGQLGCAGRWAPAGLVAPGWRRRSSGCCCGPLADPGPSGSMLASAPGPDGGRARSRPNGMCSPPASGGAMTRSRLAAAGLLLAVFALGALAGGVGVSVAEHRRAGVGTQPRGREGMLARPDQRSWSCPGTQQDSIRAILERHEPAMDSMWREVRPRFDSLRGVVRDEIRAQLTPDQAKEVRRDDRTPRP